jgi:thioredoxin-related protein
MKQLILLVLLISIFFSCDKNNDEIDVTSNNVVLLKVDYLTNKFEGGKVINFS